MIPKSFAVALLCLGLGSFADGGERRVVLILVDGLPASYLDDPQASLPVIRGLARQGVAAGSGMTIVDPSLTWPNMTTLMTGTYPDRHGVLYNGQLERRGPGQLVEYFPSRTQAELVRVPLLFDVLKAAGLSSASINWPCTRGSTSIDDNFPDVPGALAYTTPRIKDEMAKLGLLARFEGGNDVVQDEIWTELTCRIIRDRMPRFLALHLNNVDAAHHKYGPKSAPGYAAAALNDANVGRVLRALDEAGIRGETTVFLVADHGFIATPKSLKPNAVLRREGLLTASGPRATAGKVLVVGIGGAAMVYLTDPSTAAQDREVVFRLFKDAEGVAAIVEPKDYPRYHLPSPADDPEMGDLLLAAKEGYAFILDADGDDFVSTSNPTAGSHGYLASEPKMNALFIAAGAGIKPGAKLPTVANVDVAPTIARLLGTTIEGVQGRPIEAILDSPK